MNFLLKGCFVCLENFGGICGPRRDRYVHRGAPATHCDNSEQYFRRSNFELEHSEVLMVDLSLIAYFFRCLSVVQIFIQKLPRQVPRVLDVVDCPPDHRIALFMIYCIIQITMILFIILNATLKFSQRLLL